MPGAGWAGTGPRARRGPAGYTRILKVGLGGGGNGPMAFVGLVDRPVPGETEAADES